MPRRYLDYSNWVSFNQFGDLNRFISTVAMITFAVQLLFVFNFFYSIFKGRRVMTRNPWGATTLEWTTPIQHLHGNWPGEIPRSTSLAIRLCQGWKGVHSPDGAARSPNESEH